MTRELKRVTKDKLNLKRKLNNNYELTTTDKSQNLNNDSIAFGVKRRRKELEIKQLLPLENKKNKYEILKIETQKEKDNNTNDDNNNNKNNNNNKKTKYSKRFLNKNKKDDSPIEEEIIIIDSESDKESDNIIEFENVFEKKNKNKKRNRNKLKSENEFIEIDSNEEEEEEEKEKEKEEIFEEPKKYNFRKRNSNVYNNKVNITKENQLKKNKNKNNKLNNVANKTTNDIKEEKEEEEKTLIKNRKNEGKKSIRKNTKRKRNEINETTEKNNKNEKIENKKIDKEKKKVKENKIVEPENELNLSSEEDKTETSNILNDINISENITIEDNLSEDSENDEDWEQIEISEEKSELSSSDKLLSDKRSITISFDKLEKKKQKKKGINKQDRLLRKDTHKTQILCFLSSCQIWNLWCCSNLIKNLALSVLPEYLLKYNEKNIKSGNIKQLTEIIEELCEWFNDFFGKENIKEIMKLQTTNHNQSTNKKKKNNDKKVLDSKNNKNESDDNVISMDKKNIIKRFEVKNTKILSLFFQKPYWIKEFENSENIYIIIFILFARIIGFQCRFVASLYPIPISFSKKKVNTNEAIKLWCEIYCNKEKKWITVNPLYSPFIYTKAKNYKIKCPKPINYIVTINEDGFIKDRTKLYDKNFYLSTWKLRIEEEWISDMLNNVFNKNCKDDKLKEIIPEDEDPDKQLVFPTSIGGFVNHPLYALERHVKQYEILFSKEPILGYIRNEPIYPRSNVRPVSTEGHWIREGLQIKKGEKPLKYAKSKAYMIKQFRLDYLVKNNMALPKDYELGEEMVPLYGKWQTELYVPAPIIDGKIPKSKYGNIDLFKPHMLPKGAVHLNYNGIIQIAKKLNIDYAEAVTDIDIAGHHYVPVISGIVVTKENAEIILSKYNSFEKERQRKLQEKKERRIYSNWRRLIKKLVTREHLIMKYGYGNKNTK
ncbi:Rad4-domain-containing protein [Anaeromyces robustus]|uniref:Rad4-domain-containing protein n=1 Tax=Anaeromyces robustus TaxID=1754192 RepID=A0A1Y1XIH7_9FUNG|nr:Rad4-domain-containing protein [Anaeromyces robustus]|eukprot:ORX85555.1 Rad4-domain-containing protein [Anaeromyces robustus]